MFGFESCQRNSLEQLCINYANERLQLNFVERMLLAEQNLYRAEGLVWDAVPFLNNTACALMIDGPCGLFALLDEVKPLFLRHKQNGFVRNWFYSVCRSVSSIAAQRKAKNPLWPPSSTTVFASIVCGVLMS